MKWDDVKSSSLESLRLAKPQMMTGGLGQSSLITGLGVLISMFVHTQKSWLAIIIFILGHVER